MGFGWKFSVDSVIDSDEIHPSMASSFQMRFEVGERGKAEIAKLATKKRKVAELGIVEKKFEGAFLVVVRDIRHVV